MFSFCVSRYGQLNDSVPWATLVNSSLCDSTCLANVGKVDGMSEKDAAKLVAAYGCDGCGGHWFGTQGTLNGTGARGCQWLIGTENGKGITLVKTTFAVGL